MLWIILGVITLLFAIRILGVWKRPRDKRSKQLNIAFLHLDLGVGTKSSHQNFRFQHLCRWCWKISCRLRTCSPKTGTKSLNIYLKSPAWPLFPRNIKYFESRGNRSNRQLLKLISLCRFMEIGFQSQLWTECKSFVPFFESHTWHWKFAFPISWVKDLMWSL